MEGRAGATRAPTSWTELTRVLDRDYAPLDLRRANLFRPTTSAPLFARALPTSFARTRCRQGRPARTPPLLRIGRPRRRGRTRRASPRGRRTGPTRGRRSSPHNRDRRRSPGAHRAVCPPSRASSCRDAPRHRTPGRPPCRRTRSSSRRRSGCSRTLAPPGKVRRSRDRRRRRPPGNTAGQRSRSARPKCMWSGTPSHSGHRSGHRKTSSPRARKRPRRCIRRRGSTSRPCSSPSGMRPRRPDRCTPWRTPHYTRARTVLSRRTHRAFRAAVPM